MTLYQKKTFTVPASSEKSPPDCRHGWIDAHGKCVLCGDPSPVKPKRKQLNQHNRRFVVGVGEVAP